ncbi:MAG: hypothetical protein OXU39_05610 [Gemmatimonadota bacterium]|nr:hypothetical protein [Gemmatimonadota bacterium]
MAPARATAQNRSIFLVGGYGTTTFQANADDFYRNDFSATVAPVFLFTMGQDVVFESELEFGLDGATTTTGLEYAQIDYLGFDRVQLIAGKFLLPFGVFGERLHPSWINKLPTGPVTYGHAHGGVAESGLLPVLSDVGAMVRWVQPTASGFRLDFSGYVTQGPKVPEPDGHDEEEEEAPADPLLARSELAESPAPSVAFGTSYPDNNKNKMVGGRLGLLAGGSAGAYVSGFTSTYDDDGELNYAGGSLSLEWRFDGYELRGEGVLTRQEFHDDEEDVVKTLARSGYYLQLAKRINDFEPVVRWGTLADGTAASETLTEGHNEMAFGLIYWVRPTVPFKISYEIHQDLDDRMFVQWAYGF